MLFYYRFDNRNNLLHHLYIHLLTSVYTVDIYNDSYPITKTFSWEAVCHTHCQDYIPGKFIYQTWGYFPLPSFLSDTCTVGTYSNGKLKAFCDKLTRTQYIPAWKAFCDILTQTDIFPWEAVCKYTLKNLLKYFNCIDISQLDSLCDILILSTYSNGKLSLKYLHCKDILPMEAFSDLPTMWVHFSHGKPFIYVAIRQRKNLFPMGSFLWQKLHCWGTFLYGKLFVTHLHVHMYTEETYCNSHMRLSVTYLHCRNIFP